MTAHRKDCGRYCPYPDTSWIAPGALLPKCRGGDCTLCDELECTCGAQPKQAGWSYTVGNVTVCGVRMVEANRKSEGVRWCFRCRKRVEFVRVVKVPDGESYYGPTVDIRCTNCDLVDGDMFPGRYREWEEE